MLYFPGYPQIVHKRGVRARLMRLFPCSTAKKSSSSNQSKWSSQGSLPLCLSLSVMMMMMMIVFRSVLFFVQSRKLSLVLVTHDWLSSAAAFLFLFWFYSWSKIVWFEPISMNTWCGSFSFQRCVLFRWSHSWEFTCMLQSICIIFSRSNNLIYTQTFERRTLDQTSSLTDRIRLWEIQRFLFLSPCLHGFVHDSRLPVSPPDLALFLGHSCPSSFSFKSIVGANVAMTILCLRNIPVNIQRIGSTAGG